MFYAFVLLKIIFIITYICIIIYIFFLKIMCKILSEVSHLLSQEQISEIAEVTHGYTGGDLKLLCDKSNLFCLCFW